MSKELEQVAELEHEQWMKWAKALMDDENLSPERIKRWKKLFIDYDKLKEKDKKDDRKWARKVMKVAVEETFAAKMIEMNKRELLKGV